MKANLKNLISALQERYISQGIKVKVYVNDEDEFDLSHEDADLCRVDVKGNDVQIGIFSSSVPCISDASMIADSFFSNMGDVMNVNRDFGYIEFYVSDGKFRKNVDSEVLGMALPHGAVERIGK